MTLLFGVFKQFLKNIQFHPKFDSCDSGQKHMFFKPPFHTFPLRFEPWNVRDICHRFLGKTYFLFDSKILLRTEITAKHEGIFSMHLDRVFCAVVCQLAVAARGRAYLSQSE